MRSPKASWIPVCPSGLVNNYPAWRALTRWFLTSVIVAMMSFLTELTSNIASTEMILPILAGMAVSIQINPLLLMIPATLAASLAFMLPRGHTTQRYHFWYG